MSTKAKLTCWWCNKHLLQDTNTKVIIHAEVAVPPDGYKVKVHKVCEAAARASLKPVTAQPPEQLGFAQFHEDN